MEIFEGATVRCLRGQDEPVWVGKDVCDVLGISKYRDALLQLDDDERVSVAVDTLSSSSTWSRPACARLPIRARCAHVPR